MSHSEYILGTRGSALALTQSRLAAESVTELYAKHQPGGEPADDAATPSSVSGVQRETASEPGTRPEPESRTEAEPAQA